MNGDPAEVAFVELPPHARRIHVLIPWRWCCFGTTSACAENTGTPAFGKPSTWNYLRMRGEYAVACDRVVMQPELPPHARRIR